MTGHLMALSRYEWPGNIRELENVLERTILFCEGPVITQGDLPEAIGGPGEPVGAAEPPASTSFKDVMRAKTEHIERELITVALEATGWNVTHAAKQLEISRKSLQTKMKELGLRSSDDPSR
jgi:two-component system response regulator AtoC